MRRFCYVSGALALTLLTLVGCGNRAESRQESSGVISIDGSSTVYPITEAVAEEYQKASKNRSARVTVGVSGTGGGFKKFCRGETAISDASRPISPTEVSQCRERGVEYVELPVAYDGIVVVVHPSNTWVDHMTTAELRALWTPAAQKQVTRWSQVREGWPDREVNLFGPGVDSGTYDYFTQAVVGEEHSSRGDFASSEDDNVLVQGVATDPGALGFFGYAYFEENRSRLKAVPIDDGDPANGAGPIAPSPETVADGTYQPLARPVFIYVSTRAANERTAVAEFVTFYLEQAPSLVREVGYIPLPPRAYELVRERFSKRIPGSAFGGGGSKVGVTVEQLLGAEGG
jgi:phosphate transport system substrate-binding protein